MPGTLSVSLNPQLYIQNYVPNFVAEFQKMTGFDLSKEDALHRNDLPTQIREDGSHHIILSNVQSQGDWEKHAMPFCEAWGICPAYGAVIRDNVLFWAYDCAALVGSQAHTSFETKSIFLAIDEIAKKFQAETLSIKDLARIRVVNECWHDIYEARKEAGEKAALATSVYDFDAIFLDGDKVATAASSKPRTIVDGALSIPSIPMDFNCRRFDLTESNTLYHLELRGIHSDVTQFTAGVYNFCHNRVVHYETYPAQGNVSFSVLTGERLDELAICIYAGRFGHTSGHQIAFDYIRLTAQLLVSEADCGMHQVAYPRGGDVCLRVRDGDT